MAKGKTPSTEPRKARNSRADAGEIPTKFTAGEIAWIANAMFVYGVKKKEAPSLFAWGFLDLCKRDPEMKTFFFQKMLPMALPSKADRQEKTQETLEDDGRDQ